jgi:peptide deformylase
LSVPGFYEDIERAKKVTCTYQDREGAEHTIEATDLLAVAIQHEMDHLNGKLFIEKLSYSKRKKFEKELKKQLRENKKAS